MTIAPSGDDPNILYFSLLYQTSTFRSYFINIAQGFALGYSSLIAPLVFNGGNSMAEGISNGIRIRDISKSNGSTVTASGDASEGYIIPLAVSNNILYAVDFALEHLYFFSLTISNNVVTKITKTASYSITKPGNTLYSKRYAYPNMNDLATDTPVMSNRMLINGTVYATFRVDSQTDVIMKYKTGSSTVSFITITQSVDRLYPLGYYSSHVYFWGVNNSTKSGVVVKVNVTSDAKTETIYAPQAKGAILNLRRAVLNPSIPLKPNIIDGNFIFDGSDFYPVLYDLSAYGYAYYFAIIICGGSWEGNYIMNGRPRYYVAPAKTIYMENLNSIMSHTGYYLLGNGVVVDFYNTGDPDTNDIFSQFGRHAVCEYNVRPISQSIMGV